MRRFVRSTPFLAALLVLASAVPAAAVVASVSCPFNGDPGDFLSHGIVVTDYPGKNVRSVMLAYGATVAGTYRITMEIRRGSFDGPLVGVPQTVNVTLPADASHDHFVIFDFAAAPVTPGDTLTIQQTVSSPGNIFMDTGTGSCTAGHAYETQGTSPPLDSPRKPAMGIAIVADDVLSSCVPSDTVLCLDDQPGDRRFTATMNFATVQGGGFSGKGQALPLGLEGVRRGGLFWFFAQDNPEILVKVLNGCGSNGKFWVFYSAGTNIGFTLNVRDKVTGVLKSYTNADLHPASPVQDTAAFPCF
jgi:hypothetical protein